MGEGRVDLGITGRDQVVEHEVSTPPTETTGVREILDLGFGMCKLQVQVPEKGSVDRPEQLIGKNIVTSFTQLAEQYFRNLEAQHPQSTSQMNGDSGTKLRTNIKWLGGSVEAACALGVADGIVDLVGKLIIQNSARLSALGRGRLFSDKRRSTLPLCRPPRVSLIGLTPRE